jgi:hypothetical protein
MNCKKFLLQKGWVWIRKAHRGTFTDKPTYPTRYPPPKVVQSPPGGSVVDPHHLDAEPDFSLLRIWIGIRRYPDADTYPDPSFQIKAQTKCSNRLFFHTFWIVICILMRIRIRFQIQLITSMRIRILIFI